MRKTRIAVFFKYALIYRQWSFFASLSLFFFFTVVRLKISLLPSMIDNTVRNPEPLTGETIFLAYRTKMHRKLDIRAIHPITYIFFFSSFIFVILIFFPLFFFSRYLFLQPRRSLSFRTCRHFFPRRDSTNVRCARKFENSIVSRIHSKFVLD